MDYVLFSEQPKGVIFLKLKTDRAGGNLTHEYLSEIAGQPFVWVLESLKEIFLGTNHRCKYLYLFQQLQKAGCVRLPDDLESSLRASSCTTKSLIREIKVIKSDAKINVIYIMPKQDLKLLGDYITFKEISELLGKQDNDAMATEFASHLLRWQEGP